MKLIRLGEEIDDARNHQARHAPSYGVYQHPNEKLATEPIAPNAMNRKSHAAASNVFDPSMTGSE
jgi:hypothetical protein